MWCRNILRSRTICNNPAIFTYLQCLTSNSFKNVTLKLPARHLVASNTRECTIGDVIDQWTIDASPHACDLTTINRSKLNLTEQVAVIHATLKSDASIEVLDSLHDASDMGLNSRQFDFVVSNPPYVPTKKIQELQPEIRIYEDLRALDGGDDGLKVIKPLLKYAAKVLKPDGCLFVEVDPTHPEYIQFFTNKYTDLKLQHVHTYKDFCNNDRFVEVMKLA
ncbi:hypothetical protein P5V15_000693 [Pogonomyrmex californicus]